MLTYKDKEYQIVLTVRVTDDGVNCQFPTETHGRGVEFGEAIYVVHVGDVQEAPVVSDMTMSVEENTVFGTAIGTTIVATDDDNSDFVAKQTLTFVIANIQRRSWGGEQALSDVASSYFDVESTMGGTQSATGHGQLNINEMPDYEEYNQYVVSIEVTDKDGDGTEYFTVSCTITINIVNVNEAPYYKSSLVQPTIEIAENSNVSTVLSTSFQSMFSPRGQCSCLSQCTFHTSKPIPIIRSHF